MQRQLKRPYPSSIQTQPYTNESAQRYQSSLSSPQPDFEEESDTSRRVKVRFSKENHYQEYNTEHYGFPHQNDIPQQPIPTHQYISEDCNQNQSIQDYAQDYRNQEENPWAYGVDRYHEQPQRSYEEDEVIQDQPIHGQGVDYDHDRPAPYTQIISDLGQYQDDYTAETQNQRYSKSQPFQADSHIHNHHSQHANPTDHQQTYYQPNQSNQSSNLPRRFPPNNQDEYHLPPNRNQYNQNSSYFSFDDEDQVPEVYQLPQRPAKFLPIQQSEVNEDESEKYLHQEGGLASDGNYKGILENWTQDSNPVSGNITEGAEDDVEGGTGISQMEKDKQPRILAFHAPWGNDIAAAWYDPLKRRIEVLEDTKDSSGWDLALLVIEQVQPDWIIMSTKTHQGLVDKVKAWDEETRPDGSDDEKLRWHFIPRKQCTPAAAAAHLTSIRLPDRFSVTQSRQLLPSTSSTADTSEEPIENWAEDSTGLGTHRLNLVKLGCWVDVNAPLAIIATGILVSEIKQPSIPDTVNRGSGQWILDLNSIESMEVEQQMQINKDALTSLAIFDVEAHAFMYSKSQKQALSLYGLFDTCVTPLGKKLFHTWHLRPLANLKQIEARHEAVALFSANHMNFTVDMVIKNMKRIKNLPAIFFKLRSGTAKFNEWRSLHDSFEAIMDVKSTVISMAWNVPVAILMKMRSDISSEIETMRGTVNAVIDWDTSKIQSRVAVKPGVNPELDELKDTYAGLDSLLTEVSRILQFNIPSGAARDFSVIYLPQIGFHSVVVTEEDMNPPIIPGWTAKFSTTDKHYYKNQHMIDLDNHYGDIYVNMTNLEIEIIQDVTDELQKREQMILAAVDVIAELDCLLALAKAVPRFGLKRPRMTNDTSLKIHKGRHILYDQVCDTFVSNDIILQGGKDSENHNMMIVTGANGSGKSAYGKQVAMIVFMAQMGSFVPAEEAIIGICDKIFTRLQTKESSSKHASAFMIDLGQVSQALRGATEKSLIILDEFGKGTITWDGAGLLAGTIDYLQKGSCPRTVVLTHLHELITQRFLEESAGVMFAHMKTILVPKSNELHFMYKLAPGSSHTSYAAQCALQHDIPKDVVDRATFVTECVSNSELHKIHDTPLTSKQEAELRANEELAKLFLGWNIDEDTENVRDKVEHMLEDTDVSMYTNTSHLTRKSEGIDSTDQEISEQSQSNRVGSVREIGVDEVDDDSIAPSDETD
ncbi:uncharacterized protein L201_005228 [Kwoniella dendrophila CBS 6074]|uniref:DNA mismatch repair proteins mutS family domain-containing protein n=1 Tax=Kwoniella dendrophila CBS 6074 TaxID=1295534 RepID=A0AAX4JY31_9TREE